jgi:hypothetical protein
MRWWCGWCCLRRQTTDEAMGMLVRRFPAVVYGELATDYEDGAFAAD